MPPKIIHGFQPTPRDIDILSLIAKNRFATTKQIRDTFWNGVAQHNELTRLRKLKKAGLIAELMGDKWTRLGFRLTKKGINLLPSEDLQSLAKMSGTVVYRSPFRHDSILNEMRPIFEASPRVSHYLIEHEVRHMLASYHGKAEKSDEGYKVPDALFNLQTSQRRYTIALELELKIKSKSRYRKIFRALSTSPDFDLVFYIVKSERMERFLRELLKDTREKDPVLKASRRLHGFYFTLLDDIQENGLAAEFRGDDRNFSLQSLA